MVCRDGHTLRGRARWIRGVCRIGRLAMGIVLILFSTIAVTHADPPTPEEHLGYRPGADYSLPNWAEVVDYYRILAETSDRIVLEELGRSTRDRPMISAVISSAETIADLEAARTAQAALADPRQIADEDEVRRLIEQTKTVVMITCTIHSSETASTPMSMELAHRLATSDDETTRTILDNTVLLLVPSVNPDGVDIVADWYRRSLGNPWEGGGLIELYHPYAGHDTNRDWFMLNLRETQNLTEYLYHRWFPTITWDVHQMGGYGARMFVPPFFDPVNPNLHPKVSQGIFLIGAHMATALASHEKSGVLTYAMYDNWWNGGCRTVPQRHNMVGVLTESASVKLATPVFIERSELRGARRGFSNHDLAVNFPDPWPGGWWRLRDIVDYQLICAEALLTLAARYRQEFQRNYVSMGREAIEAGQAEPPYGWIVPRDQRDPGRAIALIDKLQATGIEVKRADEPFTLAGVDYPQGTWLLPADQPYRGYLKDVMERQVYPTRLDAEGKAEAPYDVAGWTMPLQMGVTSQQIDAPLPIEASIIERVGTPTGTIRSIGSGDPAYYLVANLANADFILLDRLLAGGVPVGIVNHNDDDLYGHGKPAPLAVALDQLVRGESASIPSGTLGFPANEEARTIVERTIKELPVTVFALDEQTTIRLNSLDRSTANADDDFGVHGEGGSDSESLDELAGEFGGRPAPAPPIPTMTHLTRPRIGLYQPWIPIMDEGWTRFVFDSHQIPYTVLHNAEIRAGRLIDQVSVLVIPSMSSRVLRDGYPLNATERPYVGGLGHEGLESLRAFVEEGGTLVCLEDSCRYAMAAFDLPVSNALEGIGSDQFFCPGSILGASRVESGPMTWGMPESLSLYFARSLAFELPDSSDDLVEENDSIEDGFEGSAEESSGDPGRGSDSSEDDRITVWVRYAERTPLQSGWLLGPDELAGRPALVSVDRGAGRVVLFGFPPQHRGQTQGTFRLLFNALYFADRGGIAQSEPSEMSTTAMISDESED